MRTPRFLPSLLLLFVGLLPVRAELIGYWDFNKPDALGADGSGKGNDLTGNAGTTYTADGKLGGALQLDGTTGRLTKATAVNGLPTGNSAYTISAWFKPASVGSFGIIGWGNYTFGRQVCALRLHGGNQFRHFWWHADLDATAPTNYSDGQWHHVVAVYDGATRAVWFDGVKIAQDTPGVNNASFANFAIGRTTNTFFNGALDEVAIWNDALTDAQIGALASGGSPLVGPVITAFTSNKLVAFEGDGIELSWQVNPTGATSYTLFRGATQIASGTAPSGRFTTNIPDLAGVDQDVVYTFSASETGGNKLTRTAQVIVEAKPGQPSAHGQSNLSVPSSKPQAITLKGSDPNGGTLSYVVLTEPKRGALGGTAPNLTYTPTAGLYGWDSFTFRVNDGKYDSPPATVSLVVNAPPTAPSGITLSTTRIPNTKTSGSWIADISSPDVNPGEAHTYTLVAGSGGMDNTCFAIVGHQLRAAQPLVGSAGKNYSIRLRSTDAQGMSVEQDFTLTVAAPLTSVVINEVHHNGINNTVRNEFIELYNHQSKTVDLSGWRISGAVDYQFPHGTTMAAGDYLLIAENPATIQSAFRKTALGPWNGSLSSKGETIRLRDVADAVISEVDYQVGFPWPVAADGDGASMELIHPSLDAGHGSSWRSAALPASTAMTDIASPGAKNLQFSEQAPPSIRQVKTAPTQPVANEPILVAAKVTDPDGVASVQLQYQVVSPGEFIPATLPNPMFGGRIPVTPLAPNPDFENAANWRPVEMNDDGVNGDVLGGDGIYSCVVPGQAHRTLVRYRITVTDIPGASIRVPYADDPSRNFAVFIYNGVPDYQGTPSASLTQLPTYHFITRSNDYEQCVAYDPQYRLTSGKSPDWTWENWEAAFVYNGKVYDHILYRLHGGNGRYQTTHTNGGKTSKRAFKFVFNRGSYFSGHDHDGAPYPTKWKTMVTENSWDNRGTYTFSLNEAVSWQVWNQLGIPSPRFNWATFRTIKQAEEQPDAWHGDFWGLMFVHEDFDSRFLEAHDLPDGNLYKLNRDHTQGLPQQRYQAPLAPADGSDHGELQLNLNGSSSPSYITSRVNFDRWARFHAFAEAIRHYDYWPSGDNNAAYYFYPDYQAANNHKGVLWLLPSDVDSTWGPTWNNGHDLVHNALFDDSASIGGDPLTNPTLWPRYFAQVREIRDLLWQEDQVLPLIDQFAAKIQPVVNADFVRWYGAPNDAGNFYGLGGAGLSSSVGRVALTALVADMKAFAFTGGSWPDQPVGAGGRAAFLDSLQATGDEGANLPATPTITYSGAAGFPVNDLRFDSSNFADPQGADTFGAMQWRIAEVNTSATWTPGEKRLLEVVPRLETGSIAPFSGQYRFPASACQPGHRYRARVRHQDATGRWSHWSPAAEFTASSPDISFYRDNLVVSEVMYHPSDPTAAEKGEGWAEKDFEYIEVRNIGSASIDLTDVRFTKGADFNFPNGYVLQGGASTLVVANPQAFQARYGSGKPVVGAWDQKNVLSNGGDEIKLSFGAGLEILSFTYNDKAPWPVAADGKGSSLVLLHPESKPDPKLGANWRAGSGPGSTERKR